MAKSIYTKLTRRNRTLGGFTQLWMGPDHILLLTSTRLSEKYQRFAIADIQSIVVTEMPPQTVLQIVMILAALTWMALWFAVDSRTAKWVIEITGAIGLLWPVVDMARGPRCRCVLQTRVSKELLRPVSRMAIARRFLATLRPRIEAAQGVLPVEQFAIAETAGAQFSEAVPPEPARAPGYVPEILFGTFLLNAVVLLAMMSFPKVTELPGVFLNTLFAEVVLAIVVLVRRQGRDARVVTYVVVALALIGIGFDVVTLTKTFGGWYMSVLEKAKNGDKTVNFMFIFPKSGLSFTVAWCWRLAAGSIGMIAALVERRRS